MRKSVAFFIYHIAICITVFALSAVSSEAAIFQLKTQGLKSISKGNTFSLPVIIDTKNDSITGADAIIMYDPEVLTFVSADDGKFFPFFTYKQTPGTIRASGVITDIKELKTGSGGMTTLKFKAIKSGQTKVKIFCDTSTNETSKIILSDLDATNIINCKDIDDQTLQIVSEGFIASVTKFLFGWWK